jgi:hypothetical protein
MQHQAIWTCSAGVGTGVVVSDTGRENVVRVTHLYHLYSSKLFM